MARHNPKVRRVLDKLSTCIIVMIIYQPFFLIICCPHACIERLNANMYMNV